MLLVLRNYQLNRKNKYPLFHPYAISVCRIVPENNIEFI